MLKKNFFVLIIALFFVFPMNPLAISDPDGSNGEASSSDADKGAMEGLRITSTDNDYGIRITVVSETGKKKSKETFDYWNTPFLTNSIYQLSGSTFKTEIVNKGGFSPDNVNISVKYKYKHSTNGQAAINGPWYTTTWSTIHESLYEEIKSIDLDSGKCKNPTFLDENNVNFDLCGYLEKNKCEELKKIYILIEPLVRLYNTDHSKAYVLSGTEFAHYVPAAYKKGKISYEVYSNNLGDSVFKNLMNFYLSNKPNDDLTYSLKTSTDKQIYSYFSSDPATTWLPNQTEQNLKIFAGAGRNSNGDPRGSSMQLIWLGRLADKCENECEFDPENPTFDINCCDDEEYLEEYYNNPSTNKSFQSYCCYDEGYLDFYEGIGFENAGAFIEACCFEPGSTTNYSTYASLYEKANDIDLDAICKLDSTCGPLSLNPEIILDDCDEENDENISYFRDGVFDSDSGQFGDLSIKDIEEYIEESDGFLPAEWVDTIVTDYSPNSFLAVAYSGDERYKVNLSTYCDMYCQEMFEVLLPDNYPFAEAGRYFTWSIKDSESILAKASLGKLCAVDIDLDAVIKDYQEYNDGAKRAAEALSNVTCNGYYGVDPVKNGHWQSVSAYLADFKQNCAVRRCAKAEISHEHCYTDQYGNEYGCHFDYTCVKEHDEQRVTYGGSFSVAHTGCSSGSHMEDTEEMKIHRKIDEFNDHVEGYAGKMSILLSELGKCYPNFDAELDMQVQLNYQTLFDTHSYMTPDEIIKTDEPGVSGATFACVDEKDTAECNWSPEGKDYFALNDRRDINNDGEIDNYAGIACTGRTTWTEEEKYPEIEQFGGAETEYVPVYNPNALYGYGAGLYYTPGFNTLKMITGIVGYDRLDGMFSGGNEVYTFGGDWNSIYLKFVSNHAIYELAKEINACVCKDGEVLDLADDGMCECVREVNYSDFSLEFPEEYNNYQVLPNGTLSVEFMNGPGTYPISLEYSNIGSIDEFGLAHFEPFISEDGTCPDGVCIYGDPNGVCRYVIKNRIIANPDDKCPNGDCNDICPDGDCSDICGDNDCGDYDCIDHNGKPLPHCQNVTGLNVIYRVIDVGDPFPGTDGTGRKPGSNWCLGNDCETLVKEVITNANSSVSGSTPLYSFTLTPAIIKDIRTDNNAMPNGDYLKGTLVYPNGNDVGGGRSYFLRKGLPGIINSHGGTYSINIDGKEWNR